eukprot:1084809-Rhodomonas_salina.1
MVHQVEDHQSLSTRVPGSSSSTGKPGGRVPGYPGSRVAGYRAVIIRKLRLGIERRALGGAEIPTFAKAS